MSRRGYFLEQGWYLDHAAGASMSPGQDMLLRSHLEVSVPARAHAVSMARIGGAMLESVEGEGALAFDADDIFALDEAFDAARTQPVPAAAAPPIKSSSTVINSLPGVSW